MKTYFQYNNLALKLLNKDSFYDDLYSLFCKELIFYDATCKDLVEGFATHYFLEETKLEKNEAIEASTNLFALITSSFSIEMDFSNEQWDFIRELTLASQNELSIELLNVILNVLVERKKIAF
ncbi:MAG: hypothetical protein ACTTKH_03525 [Treponema sp.]